MSLSLFVCTQLNGFKYREWLNISNWPIDKSITDPTTSGQNGIGSNGNEKVLHISPSPWTGASSFDGLVSSRIPLCRDAVGVFSSPRWLSSIVNEDINLMLWDLQKILFEKWDNEQLLCLWDLKTITNLFIELDSNKRMSFYFTFTVFINTMQSNTLRENVVFF